MNNQNVTLWLGGINIPPTRGEASSNNGWPGNGMSTPPPSHNFPYNPGSNLIPNHAPPLQNMLPPSNGTTMPVFHPAAMPYTGFDSLDFGAFLSALIAQNNQQAMEQMNKRLKQQEMMFKEGFEQLKANQALEISSDTERGNGQQGHRQRCGNDCSEIQDPGCFNWKLPHKRTKTEQKAGVVISRTWRKWWESLLVWHPMIPGQRCQMTTPNPRT